MNFGLYLPGLMGLGLLSVGAGVCPYGSVLGLPLSLMGCAASLAFALSIRGFRGTQRERLIRAGLIVVGILIQLVGTIAVATVVAGVYYARSHQTRFTGAPEIAMAGVCAVMAPGLLTFKGRFWLGLSGPRLGLLWAYWLAFYPATVIAAALGQPWGGNH